MQRVISGPEFTRAVRRSGLGNKGVAELLGVKLSTINEYMNQGVRPIRVDQVLLDLGAWLDENPLAGVSDVSLLAEVARRMVATEQARAACPNSDMADSGQADHSSDSPASSGGPVAETSGQTRGDRIDGRRRAGVRRAKGTDDDPGNPQDR